MSATEAAIASSANNTGAIAEVVSSGQVLAQLNDWRAITFVLVVVIVVLLLERYWSNKDMRAERKAMMDVATKFAENAGEVAQAMSALRTEIMAFRITTARVESVVTTQTMSKLEELRGE